MRCGVLPASWLLLRRGGEASLVGAGLMLREVCASGFLSSPNGRREAAGGGRAIGRG
jgi:hypothetical protein